MENPTKNVGSSYSTRSFDLSLYEVVGVTVPTVERSDQEKFGDGIMSAIDFSMKVEKEEDPKRRSCRFDLETGRFLPYNLVVEYCFYE